MRREALCTIGKATYAWPLSTNHQDLEVYRELVQRLELGRVYLVVQSENTAARVGHVDSILAVCVPKLRSPALNYLWFIFASTRVGLRLAKQGVTLFQASEPSAAGIAGVLIKTVTGARLIVHLQGDLFNLPRGQFSWWRRAFARYVTTLVSRKADRVRCVSRALIRAAAEAGVEQDRLVLVPSRCDTTRFDPDLYKAQRERLRANWGVPSNTPILLFVGSLTVHKGVSHLLGALSDITRQGLIAVLVLVGAGGLEERLRQEARDLGVADRVRFCGWIPYDQLPPYMAAADLFVLPSLDEGLPRALLEAMAMRLPAIASAVGGIPEVVVNQETGLLVEPASSQRLAAALAYALRNPQATMQWSARARELVERNYSFQAGIERYASMISELRAEQGHPLYSPD